MNWTKSLLLIATIWFFILSGCGPKDVTTDPEELSAASKSWIPFEGNESVTFVFDTSKMVFTGTGKESFFETVRYKTDQGGLFNFQEDYYADLERETLGFLSPSTPFYFS